MLSYLSIYIIRLLLDYIKKNFHNLSAASGWKNLFRSYCAVRPVHVLSNFFPWHLPWKKIFLDVAACLWYNGRRNFIPKENSALDCGVGSCFSDRCTGKRSIRRSIVGSTIIRPLGKETARRCRIATTRVQLARALFWRSTI